MRIALALVVLAACGDNNRCPVTPPAAPRVGPLAEPYAHAPPGCLAGALGALPGRWFVLDRDQIFAFDYPRFEGDCETGFTRASWFSPDDDLAEDGVTFHSWSDGTIYYNRHYSRFERPDEPPFEVARSITLCMVGDDQLAGVRAFYDTDRGQLLFPVTGERFGPKDEGAVGLVLVGELGQRLNGDRIGRLTNVVVDGAHAYVVGSKGLDVIDVANPAAPIHRGHVPGAFNDIKLVRGGGKLVAYVSPSLEEETFVIDVTEPTAPAIVGRIPEYSHSVQTQAKGATTLLYLATYTAEVPVYDVTSPLTPVRIGAASMRGDDEAGIHDLHVDGDVIYANKTTDGIVAVDVTNGFAAAAELGRLVTSYSHAGWAGIAGGRPILVHGDEGFSPRNNSAAFLRIIDADRASPTYMRELARYQTRPEVGIHNFQLVGDKVYIAYYHDGVRVVDLANPTQPREVARFNTWNPDTAPGSSFEAALGIRVVGDLIYVADSLRGLLILAPT